MDASNSRDDFRLSAPSGDGGFQRRSLDVFGALGALEDGYQRDVDKRGDTGLFKEEKEEEDVICRKRRRDERSEGAFKHPGQPPAKRRHGNVRGRQKRAPDFVVHPQNWVKYSLAETGEEGLGVRGDDLNRKIALDFLKDRKEKSDESGNDDEKTEGDTKVTFRKPEVKKSLEVKEEKDKSGNGTSLPFVDHVHRMPEYVIGRDKRKDFKKKASATATSDMDSQTSSNLQLAHLDDEASKSDDNAMSRDKLASHDQNEDQSEETKVPSSSSQSQGANFKSFKGKGGRKIRRRATEDEEEN